MAELLNKTLAPGFHIVETENVAASSSTTFDGADITTGACVGIFKRGKIGKPLLVTRDNFESIVGGPINNAFGYYSLKGYFDNGATKALVVRVAHYTDISDPRTLTARTAEGTVYDRNIVSGEDRVPTMKIRANSEGVWGNDLYVSIADSPIIKTKVNTDNGEAVAVGSTTIKLLSVKNIEPEMMIKINNQYFSVVSVDRKTKTIKINGTIGTAVPNATDVTSCEFKISVYDGLANSEPVEVFDGLDIRETSSNYFEEKINSNSTYIEVEDLFSDSVFPTNLPSTDVLEPASFPVHLAGGNDGLGTSSGGVITNGIVADDFIGNESAGTGVYAFKQTREAFRLWCAETSDFNVFAAYESFCEDYMYAVCSGTFPENVGVEDAIDYKESVGINSSFSSLLYGWGYVYDPIGYGNSPKKLVPLTGHFIGMWARINTENDISAIPAGEEAVLYGVYSLNKNLSESEIATLNTSGINSIVYINGIGVVNWGARTTSEDKKWRYLNARAIFEYVEKSIQEGTRWAVFQPTTQSTWNRLTLACKSFLNTVPGLSGETVNERYSFVCDETNNPIEVRNEGKIISDVGLNIEGIGEFIVFRVGHMKSDTVIEE